MNNTFYEPIFEKRYTLLANYHFQDYSSFCTKDFHFREKWSFFKLVPILLFYIILTNSDRYIIIKKDRISAVREHHTVAVAPLFKKGAKTSFSPFNSLRGGDSMQYITLDQLISIIMMLITFAHLIVSVNNKSKK